MPKLKKLLDTHKKTLHEVEKKHYTRSQSRTTNLEMSTNPLPDTITQPTAIREYQLKDLAAKSQQSFATTTEQAKAYIANQLDNMLEKLLKDKINFNTASEYITKKQTINRENDLHSLKHLEDIINDYNEKLQNVSDNSNNHSFITSDTMDTYQTLEQKSDSQEFPIVWQYFHNMSPSERHLFNAGWEVTSAPIIVDGKKGFKQEVKVSKWKDDAIALALDRQHPHHDLTALQKFIKHKTEKLLNEPVIAHLKQKLQTQGDPKNTVREQILEYLDTGEQPADCEFRIETYYPELDKKLQKLRAGTRMEGKGMEGIDPKTQKKTTTFIPKPEGKRETYVTTETDSLWSKFTGKEDIHDSEGKTRLNTANFSQVLIGSIPQVKEYDDQKPKNQIAKWLTINDRIINENEFIIGFDSRSSKPYGVYIVADKREDKIPILRISNQSTRLTTSFDELTMYRIYDALKGHNGAQMPTGIEVYTWLSPSKPKDSPEGRPNLKYTDLLDQKEQE